LRRPKLSHERFQDIQDTQESKLFFIAWSGGLNCNSIDLAKMKTLIKMALLCIVAGLLAGCMVGRTGKIGKPISAYYEQQLESLKLGVSTPDDLKKAFTITKEVKEPHQSSTVIVTKVLPYLKEVKMEDGKKVEIWGVSKGGDIDVAELLIWGGVAYNKDQELQFRFENDKLVSYESIVIPDPPVAPISPAPSPHNSH
jgi:hypothetical protein